MNTNVTYYLGAGASYHSMPLQITLGDRLKVYRDTVYHLIKEKKSPISEIYLASIDDLLRNMNESTSIDNYAKDLYNSSSIEAKRKLIALKKILSHYLIFEQLYKGQISLFTSEVGIAQGIYEPYDEEIQEKVKMQFDKRYRTFFNDLFSLDRRTLPKNMNIISWNYDLQIEGTYCRSFEYSLEMAQQNLKIYPSVGFKDEIPQIIKLNGTAGVLIETNTLKYKNIVSGLSMEDFKQVIWRYIITDFEAVAGITNSLCFSFEKEGISKNAIKHAKRIINSTEILVIVGYSFPKMNRQIDSEILSVDSPLKKVIIQVAESDFEHVEREIRKYKNIATGEVKFYGDLKEFYFADELL